MNLDIVLKKKKGEIMKIVDSTNYKTHYPRFRSYIQFVSISI